MAAGQPAESESVMILLSLALGIFVGSLACCWPCHLVTIKIVCDHLKFLEPIGVFSPVRAAAGEAAPKPGLSDSPPFAPTTASLARRGATQAGGAAGPSPRLPAQSPQPRLGIRSAQRLSYLSRSRRRRRRRRFFGTSAIGARPPLPDCLLFNCPLPPAGSQDFRVLRPVAQRLEQGTHNSLVAVRPAGPT